jgi:uncharacterized repeat protein (TIGR03803 family)
MSKLNWVRKACVVFLLWAGAAVALPAQAFTTLYRFCSQTNCTDGESPKAALVQGTNGKLYGTTLYGGTQNSSCDGGCGTVFSITTRGTLTTLRSFDLTDGYRPT